MSRAIAVLRPEPGNRVTAAALEARGARVVRLPLFQVCPIAWELPDPAPFDALILTSANAVRHAGPQLSRLLALPVYAVGEATAQAARRAGFHVAHVGQSGAKAVVDIAMQVGIGRALHLAARERTLEAGGIVAAVIPVYASEPLKIDTDAAQALSGCIALVQSARAGARLAEVALDLASIALVAVSSTAARAAGEGWQRVVVAPNPSAEAMIHAALALAD